MLFVTPSGLLALLALCVKDGWSGGVETMGTEMPDGAEDRQTTDTNLQVLHKMPVVNGVSQTCVDVHEVVLDVASYQDQVHGGVGLLPGCEGGRSTAAGTSVRK